MSRSGCEPCVLRKVFSVKGEATADQFVPQKRLIRFTNTVALFWPPSLFDAPEDAPPAIAVASPSKVVSEEDEILAEIAEEDMDSADNHRDDEAA
jgi:hypothetical protein